MPSLTRLLCFSLITTGFLSCSSGTARAQSPDARTKGTASISGQVTIGDKSADGLVIAVFSNNPGATRGPVTQVSTDSEGVYHLVGLTAGQYNVTALAPLFVGSGSSFYGPGRAITLTSGETAEGIDFKLLRGGVITGRVTDAEGKPVIEERIGLMLLDENGNPSRSPLGSAYNYQMFQTDDRGVYRIYGLAAGRYKVSVGDDPGGGMIFYGRSLYYQRIYYSDTTDPAKANIVDLAEGGEATNIDIKLGRRASAFNATGRVVDADSGQPLPGIRVAYGAAPKNENGFYAGSVGRPTNNRGEFRLDGLAPSRYGVYLSSVYEAADVYSDLVFFDVVDADVSNIELKATHGLSLSGLIVTDGIANKEAIANLGSLRIGVSIVSPSNVRGPSSSSLPIAADGSFKIEGLRPGKAFLYLNVYGNFNAVTSESVRRFLISRIEYNGVEHSQGIELSPGQQVSGVRVFLLYGTGSISGTVRVEGGTLPPASRTFVFAVREGSPSSRSSAPIDSRGRFVIENLAAGTYEVTVQGYSLPAPRGARRGGPPKQLVTVADGLQTEVVFAINLSGKEGQ